MEKVRLAFIGVGNRGSELLGYALENPRAEIVALCDVYRPYLDRTRDKVDPRFLSSGKVPRMTEVLPDAVDRYSDYRDVLDRKDIDAVVIATPDHWHALQTIHAFGSGKDVFVEKPLTSSLHEGRAMVNAQRETGRVGAVCLNRRGSSVYRELADRVPEGIVGKIVSGVAGHSSNMCPNGIGRQQDAPPPDGLDWDFWLGPRAFRPYRVNIAPYYFRWHKDYSTQMGNWGVHYMDAIRWLTNERAPCAVTAVGGKYALDDDRDIPDTMHVLFEFSSGMTVRFEVNEASSGSAVTGGEIELRGTKGTLIADENGYRVIPGKPGQFQKWDASVDAENFQIEGENQYGDLKTKENSTANLIADFLECVLDKSKKPFCCLEEGHRSTSFAHIANIALACGRRLEWDADAERFIGDDEANGMLAYRYREPWSLT